MYPKEEYLIDLDKNVLDTLVPITDVVKGYNATFIKYPVYIKQTIELIKKLQPELTKLAFIFDRRYISQQTKADVEAVLRKDFSGHPIRATVYHLHFHRELIGQTGLFRQ